MQSQPRRPPKCAIIPGSTRVNCRILCAWWFNGSADPVKAMSAHWGTVHVPHRPHTTEVNL